MVARYGKWVWPLLAVCLVTLLSALLTPDITGELAPWAVVCAALCVAQMLVYASDSRAADAIGEAGRYVRGVRALSDRRWLVMLSDGTSVTFAGRVTRERASARVTVTSDGWTHELRVPAPLVKGRPRD